MEEGFDQRKSPRISVRVEATMQALGQTASENGAPTPVAILDFSGRGIRLEAQERLELGRAVKVTFGDTLLLGEVCYSVPVSESPGRYWIGLMTEERLERLASLAHLIQALHNTAPVAEHVTA